MVIFEQDLKNVTVAFQNREDGNIFKLELPYKEIHDNVLVDTARPELGKCSLFIPLRSVPRVFEAVGKIIVALRNCLLKTNKKQTNKQTKEL